MVTEDACLGKLDEVSIFPLAWDFFPNFAEKCVEKLHTGLGARLQRFCRYAVKFCRFAVLQLLNGAAYLLIRWSAADRL
ncbi:hypothetical protein DPMN_110909 [Dreissena polymorpha]|uniref:Uncharacterized protein n=1 Tax=Dreissena polymorpha TaxID=45954 RepID=A0A9D4KCX1_DREPO|nr:hypothetical protein DPMN_110909 [Dreissena polymorpha]